MVVHGTIGRIVPAAFLEIVSASCPTIHPEVMERDHLLQMSKVMLIHIAFVVARHVGEGGDRPRVIEHPCPLGNDDNKNARWA